MSEHVFAHPGSGVLDDQAEMVPFGPRLDGQSSPLRHGLKRVDDKIDDHLVELNRVGNDRRQFRIEKAAKLHPFFGASGFEKVKALFDDLVE